MVLAGCGGGGKDDKSDTATVDLRVVAADRADKVEASLRCDGDSASAEGFSTDAKTLCRAAVGLAPFLAQAPDPGRVCTEIYGGPQTARITGTIRGRRIARSFSRTDGCQISDWDRAKTLLPIAVK